MSAAPGFPPLLDVRGLVTRYAAGEPGARPLTAVAGVDVAVGRGEIVGLVGESGSGKTTLGRSILRLVEPDDGRIVFDGIDVRALPARGLRALRRRMQMVFQDPGSALNPRMRVGALVGEPLVVHGALRGRALAERVAALLGAVGLEPSLARRLPGELSGGQRQRVGIARALALEPDFVVCDEPVSSLDVSVQAQVVNLLAELQRSRGLAYLFIAHDLAVVGHLCDRVLVMVRGRIVEEGPRAALRANPLHPYTRALFASAPLGDPAAGPEPASGCRFRARCAFARARCAEDDPALRELAVAHRVACHFAEEIAASGPVTGVPTKRKENPSP